MAIVVSFINYKGGVGKTTSTYHIGCSLAGHHRKRVLFIDIDPQTNLTFLCAPYEKWEQFKKRAGTIKDMYKRYQGKKAVDTKRFIWRSPIEVLNGRARIDGLDLVPCDIDLIGEDLSGAAVGGVFPNVESLRRNSKAFLRDRNFLRTVLKEVDHEYDYVLIDCPPNLYLMTQNALVASDYYIVTAIPDHLSTIGLSILKQKVDKIGKMLESARTFAGEAETHSAVAKLGGVIFVKVRLGGSRITVVHEEKMQEVPSILGPVCFERHTTELIGYSEAAAASVPVWAYPSSNAEKAANKGEYQSITKEFLRRFPV